MDSDSSDEDHKDRVRKVRSDGTFGEIVVNQTFRCVNTISLQVDLIGPKRTVIQLPAQCPIFTAP